MGIRPVIHCRVDTSSMYENCYFNVSTELFETKYCKYHSGEYLGQLCEKNRVQLHYSVFRKVLKNSLVPIWPYMHKEYYDNDIY